MAVARWIVGAVVVALAVIGTGGVDGAVVVGSAAVVMVGGTRLADLTHRGADGGHPLLADVLGWGSIALGILILLWGVWNVWLPSMTGG